MAKGMIEPIPAYDESLYRKTKRKFDKESGKPIKHSRWNKKSGVPRYSKPQEKAIGSRREQGWHRGARVYV